MLKENQITLSRGCWHKKENIKLAAVIYEENYQ